MRRASLLAERKLKAVSLENSLVQRRHGDKRIWQYVYSLWWRWLWKWGAPQEILNPIYLNVVHLDYTLSCVRQMLPRLKYSEKLYVHHSRLWLQKRMKSMMTSIFQTTLHCFALPVKMMFFYPFLIAGDAQHAKWTWFDCTKQSRQMAPLQDARIAMPRKSKWMLWRSELLEQVSALKKWTSS